MAYTYEYPRPAVTADCVVMTKDDTPKVLLIQRAGDPFKGSWAFPGGFMNMDEDTEQCAVRELEEETGLVLSRTRQIGAYSAVGRDPRGRTITVAYLAIVENTMDVVGQDDAANADWFPVDALPHLAFDHEKILRDALHLLYTDCPDTREIAGKAKTCSNDANGISVLENRLLNCAIGNLVLPVKIIRGLTENGAVKFQDIPLMSLDEVNRIKGFGRKAVYDLQEFLANFGMSLGMSQEDIDMAISAGIDEKVIRSFTYNAVGGGNPEKNQLYINREDRRIETPPIRDYPGQRTATGQEYEERLQKDEVEQENEKRRKINEKCRLVDDVLTRIERYKYAKSSHCPKLYGKPWRSDEKKLLAVKYKEGKSLRELFELFGHSMSSTIGHLNGLLEKGSSLKEIGSPSEDGTFVISKELLDLAASFWTAVDPAKLGELKEVMYALIGQQTDLTRIKRLFYVRYTDQEGLL